MKTTIGEIIKENKEYFNYSNADISKIANIDIKTVRNIINNKTEPDIKTLSKLEDIFEMHRGDLITLQMNINSLKKDIKIDEAASNKLNKIFKTTSYETIKLKTIKLLKGMGTNEYKGYLKNNLVGYYKYRENDLANIWIALSLKQITGRSYPNKFYKTDSKSIDSKVIEIMLTDNSFDKKIKDVNDVLTTKGIYLINTPFIKSSTIRGATFKLNNKAFILMNDNGKRECYYIFTLLHELVHLIGAKVNEKDINSLVAKKIRAKLTNSKISKEMEILMDTYDNVVVANGAGDVFDKIRNKTSIKINFGDDNKFIENNM